MEETLRLLAYSDIHYDRYNNGLTLEDIQRVDELSLQIGIERDVHCWLFGGDWFADKNPDSGLRAIRDAALARKADHAMVAALVGNHDRESKGMHSQHNLNHVKIWDRDMQSNLVIMDEARDYRVGSNLTITAVPAGHKFRPQVHRNTFNLCMFHDMALGSLQQNGQKALHGFDLSVLDSSDFQLVLGGDNHVRQKLPTRNVEAHYIGAALQHNWGDRDQARGFMYIEINTAHKATSMMVQYIDSGAPRFIELDDNVGADRSFKQVESDVVRKNGSALEGHIVRIILRGDAAQLCSISKVSTLERSLREQTGARSLKIITEPYTAVKELIPELKATKTPMEDWKVFVSSGKLPDIDPDALMREGEDIINTIENGTPARTA
jgi:DNA repair exonuclease SbcCD nuclease subunit